MSKKYKVSIIEFNGEGESLKAQGLYEQTVESLDIRKVIEAVNAGARLETNPILTNPRKRAPRSDRGRVRAPKLQPAFTATE